MNFVANLLTVTQQSFSHFGSAFVVHVVLCNDYALSFTTVKFWEAEFKHGRKSLGDDERLVRPKTPSTDDNFAKVNRCFLTTAKLK